MNWRGTDYAGASPLNAPTSTEACSTVVRSPKRPLVIRHTPTQPDVRERVLHAVLNHLQRAGRHIGPRQGAVEEVVGVADGRREDLGFEAVVVVDGTDRPDQLHPILADIIEPPDERAD